MATANPSHIQVSPPRRDRAGPSLLRSSGALGRRPAGRDRPLVRADRPQAAPRLRRRGDQRLGPGPARSLGAPRVRGDLDAEGRRRHLAAQPPRAPRRPPRRLDPRAPDRARGLEAALPSGGPAERQLARRHPHGDDRAPPERRVPAHAGHGPRPRHDPTSAEGTIVIGYAPCGYARGSRPNGSIQVVPRTTRLRTGDANPCGSCRPEEIEVVRSIFQMPPAPLAHSRSSVGSTPTRSRGPGTTRSGARTPSARSSRTRSTRVTSSGTDVRSGSS